MTTDETHNVTRYGTRDETGHVTRSENVPRARASQTTTKELPPTARESYRPRERRTTKARIKAINPTDGLAAFIASLRPDWTVEAIHAALTDDPRPPAVAGPAAVTAALNPEVGHPNAIKRYDTRQPTPVPPQLRCAHGVAAIDEDGRNVGIGCVRCRPPAAPLPRCEHGKPYGVGCRTCQESA